MVLYALAFFTLIALNQKEKRILKLNLKSASKKKSTKNYCTRLSNKIKNIVWLSLHNHRDIKSADMMIVHYVSIIMFNK